METNTGVSQAQILGRDLFECFPQLPKKWVTQKIRSVFILKNFAFTSWRQRPYLLSFPPNRPVTGGIDRMQQDLMFLPVKDASGEVRAVCITLFDATDACMAQRAAEEASEKLRGAMRELEELSTRDGLTGTLNRRALDQRFADEIKRFKRYRSPLAFLLFDIDHFKRVNDTHGHLAGDEVLRQVAARIVAGVRDTDVVGRYGGEELAAILPGTSAAGAVVVGERLRSAIEANQVEVAGAVIRVTVSVGISEARPSTGDMKELVAEADAALYQGKRQGRNQVICFAPAG
jgi:diguanylate cyclase (GGDEF)-like protein